MNNETKYINDYKKIWIESDRKMSCIDTLNLFNTNVSYILNELSRDPNIDVVLFFIDPLYSHPHEVDIHMLMRLCNVYDIPLVTNYSTASYLIKGLKYEQNKHAQQEI